MDKTFLIKNSREIPSPALIFYQDKIVRNIEIAVAIAKDPARLRPHVKTHKTREIVKMQMSAGIGKFKCATIAEAEMLALCGAKDVLLAYPLVGPNIDRFICLIQTYPKTTFKAMVENITSADELSRAAEAGNLRIETFIDIDPGLHRTGVEPGEKAVELYRHIARLGGLSPAGIHCYDGQNHQHDREERREAAAACYTMARGLREKLISLGLSAKTLILGGTPTFPMYAAYPEVELSPGTCFLNDYDYSSSYTDMDFERAAVVLSRVISVNSHESTFTLDLGAKAIATDPKGVRGIILNMKNTEPLFQNEEHWVFRVPASDLPEIGDEAYVLPTHICPTCALYADAQVIDSEGNWNENWEIVARKRKLSV